MVMKEGGSFVDSEKALNSNLSSLIKVLIWVAKKGVDQIYSIILCLIYLDFGLLTI